jgi:predicted fused transcriptional regulator/phosphomethylpyrimidine kinase
MSHLVEVYAKDLGVKIGKPYFQPHFFPLLEENYITIHHDNKVQSKEYDYWEEVISLVKQQAPDVKFIQVGSGKEPKIKNVTRFAATHSIKQSAYIIKNALMHVGTDSLPVHIASSFDKPIVSIYAHTYASTCCPAWGSKKNHTIIESDRDGKKPSYSLKESPKQINLIKPERIANAILKKLSKNKNSRKTIFIGDKYKEDLIHIIPDNKYDLSSKKVVLRFDLLHNEENTLHLFKDNQVSIVTSVPLTDEILSQKNINCINYLSDHFDEEFIERTKKKGLTLRLFCTKKEVLNEQRYKFFDIQISLLDKSKKIEEAKKLAKLPRNKLKIKSYTIYFKNGEAYHSLFEANGKENLDDIFIDLDKLMLYTD